MTTNGELIAVTRLFDLLGLDDEHIKKEFHKLSRLKHPNLVRLLSYCYEDNGDAVHSQQTNRALCFKYLYSDSLQTYISGTVVLQFKNFIIYVKKEKDLCICISSILSSFTFCR